MDKEVSKSHWNCTQTFQWRWEPLPHAGYGETHECLRFWAYWMASYLNWITILYCTLHESMVHSLHHTCSNNAITESVPCLMTWQAHITFMLLLQGSGFHFATIIMDVVPSPAAACSLKLRKALGRIPEWPLLMNRKRKPTVRGAHTVVNSIILIPLSARMRGFEIDRTWFTLHLVDETEWAPGSSIHLVAFSSLLIVVDSWPEMMQQAMRMISAISALF